MNLFRLFLVMSSVLAVLGGYGCGTTNSRGEKRYVQTFDGLSGYTVYIRENAPPPPNVYIIRKPEKKESSENILSNNKEDETLPQDSLSSLYYYRSSNPNRLPRVRLRRFPATSDELPDAKDNVSKPNDPSNR